MNILLHEPAATAVSARRERAPYSAPCLRVYGTLATLTRNTVCSVNTIDGGKGCGGSFKGKS